MTRLARVARGLLALAAGAHVLQLAWVIAGRVGWPLDLEWMEGSMLTHALRVLEGAPLYAPPSLEFVPHLYTPLLPWLLAGLGEVLPLGYVLGRSVSIACFGALLAVVFAAVRREGVDRIGALAACGLIAACFPLVDGFYDLVRPDSLFVALVAGGLLVLRHGHTSNVGVAGAALLLSLAFLAKQTAAPFIVAAPVALLGLAPRRIPLFVAVVAVVDGGTTLWLDARTDGWFWRTIFELHQSHDFDGRRFRVGAGARLLGALPVVAGVLAVWAVVRARSRRVFDGADYWALFALVAVVATALSWSTQWASRNAFLPALVFLSLFAPIAADRVSGQLARAGGLGSLAPGLLALALAVQLAWLRWDPAEHRPGDADRRRADAFLGFLEDLAREGDVLVPYHSWYPTLVGRPSHLHQMGIRDFRKGGVPPPPDLARAVAEGRYAAVVLDGRPDRAYGRALAERYVREPIPERLAPATFEGFEVRPRWLWRPRGPEVSTVVVYVVDTLRADHLGLYGYGRDTSPALEAFARDAVVFERAFAPAAWTKPAVASLFTGLYPSRHGAVRRGHRLAPGIPSLPQLLDAAGWETAAFVSNPNLLPVFGFGRGFDRFVDVESVAYSATAESVLTAVDEFLDTRGEGPLFLYVHTLDPHEPYEPPGPDASRYAPPSESDENQRAQARYDGEIAYGDRQLGRFLQGLRERGLYDDALIVFTSDHGEEFRDHGGTLHGHTLYGELLRVPLVLKLPAGRHAGLRVETPARLIDVFPTLLASLGIDAPEGLDGHSLLPGLEPGRTPTPVELFAELDLGPHSLASLTVSPYKLIERLRPEPEIELFDLVDDPREQNDLSGERPELAAAMRGRLDAVRSRLGGGIHLVVVNGPGPSHHRTARGRILVRGGRVASWSATELEADDAVGTSDGDSVLHFHLELRNEPNPIGQNPRILRDVDRIQLRVEPADATLELAVEPPAPPLALGRRPPRDVRLPFRTRADDPGLARERAPRPPGPGGGPFLRLYHLPEATPVVVEIEDDLAERLRALGYAEEAEEAEE